MNNWFGWESHPSDHLIHWNDVKWRDNGKRMEPKIKEHIEAIRAAWDLLHSTPGLAAAHELLDEGRRHIEDMLRGEDEAGEDL